MKKVYEGTLFWFSRDSMYVDPKRFMFNASARGHVQVLSASALIKSDPLLMLPIGELADLRYSSDEIKEIYEKNGFATALLLARVIFFLSRRCAAISTNGPIKEGRGGGMYRGLGFTGCKGGDDKNYTYSLFFSDDLAELVHKNAKLRGFSKKMKNSGVSILEILDSCNYLSALIKKHKLEEDYDFAGSLLKFVRKFKKRYLQ